MEKDVALIPSAMLAFSVALSLTIFALDNSAGPVKWAIRVLSFTVPISVLLYVLAMTGILDLPHRAIYDWLLGLIVLNPTIALGLCFYSYDRLAGIIFLLVVIKCIIGFIWIFSHQSLG